MMWGEGRGLPHSIRATVHEHSGRFVPHTGFLEVFLNDVSHTPHLLPQEQDERDDILAALLACLPCMLEDIQWSPDIPTVEQLKGRVAS